MSENRYLSGNFAPVDGELDEGELRVAGRIPRQLEGLLARIGPNPIAPDPKSHHWFLGNGMVHGVRLQDGRALWYRRRYVRDDEVVQALGWPPVPGPRREDAIGPGIVNTHVKSHAGRILALVEAGSLPVELDRGLETIARCDFDGTLPAGFSAHPKHDPDTDELHAVVYSPDWEHVQHVVVGSDGRVGRAVDVPVPGRPMVHDCALTQRYVVLLDLPVILDPEPTERGFAMPYAWHEEYGARVGLLPRDGDAADVVWCEVSPCYVFHTLNAYDAADGRVVLDVVRHERMFATDLQGPNEGSPTLERWIVDPQGGPVKEERLHDAGQEFPRLDERRVGKPHRFGYSASYEKGLAFGGLFKHDLRSGSVEIHHEGDERFFLEPVFVPAGPDAAEDEGWVLAYVYDASANRSDVVILHAQDFAGDPVATIQLPQRVPYGFHGSWIPDEG